MTDAVQQLAERLSAIKWTSDEDRYVLHVRLGQEYLRRAALWIQALGVDQESMFFDIAEVVDPESRASPVLIQRVREHLDEQRASGWPQIIAGWALHFAALPVVPPGLPSPYEPLIVMLERGGYFKLGTGVLTVDHLGIRLGDWREHLSEQPVIGLTEAELDAVDVRPQPNR